MQSKTQPAYEWAKNELSLNRLQKPLELLENKIQQYDFIQLFLLNDYNEVQKAYSDHEARTSTSTNNIQDDLKNLEKEVSRFNKMHAASRQSG